MAEWEWKIDPHPDEALKNEVARLAIEIAWLNREIMLLKSESIAALTGRIEGLGDAIVLRLENIEDELKRRK